MMFLWGWEWQAKPYLKDNFLVKFPSMQKIDEMKGYHYFGLIGTKATIKVDRWTNSSIASYKLYVCWVRIDGVPEPLEHYQGFCEAGSLIGNVLELDMELYRQCGVVRAKIGVMDPRKIPASAPLNESGLVYNIFFELEDIVEEGGPLEGGVLVSYPRPSAPTQQTTDKRPRERNEKDELICSKSPRNDSDAVGIGGNAIAENPDEVVSSQYELDKSLLAEREVRQKLLDKKHLIDKVGSGVEQINADFAKDADMMENFTERDGSQQDDEYDCTQDPEDFARRLGISTQRIKEIEAEVEEELLAEENCNLRHDKENLSPTVVKTACAISPPGRAVATKQTSFSNKVQGVVLNPLQDLGAADITKQQKLREAEARVQKAKEKAALDEAARRRSDRNKHKEEVQTMDKATDMARRKNLETPGMAPTDLNTAPNIPTVLNTVPSFILHITQCIGVSLGKTPEEIDSTISMIKSLEKTRSDLFLANMRKRNNVEDSDEESKLGSFDPDTIRNLVSDSECESEDDEELRDELILLSSLYKSKLKQTCAGGVSVKPKVKCGATKK
ncbi:hypothetical protein ACQJBY_013553 [Aegilops geniculata]